MRADGSEFPLELIVTRAELPGPPLFCGYLRDMTEAREREREQLRLAAEQAALRRVATAVAAGTDPWRVFGVVTEEVARLLGAQSSNMVRFDDDTTATVVGGWSEGEIRNVPVGDTVRMDGDTASARVHRTGAPARIDDYDALEGELAVDLRALGFRSPWPRRSSSAGGSGRGDRLERRAEGRSRRRRAADRRLRRARGAGAGQRQRARGARRLARPDRRGRRRRAAPPGAQPPRRRAAAAGVARTDAADGARAGTPAIPTSCARATSSTHALQELRELARGIHPAVLTERGLEPAVEALATRASVPVELDVTLETSGCPARSRPRPTTSSPRALTNVAKYAHASEVSVGVERANGHACIEVRDDGIGGAAAEGGSGLRGLADRVEALGGRFVLTSPAGAGTHAARRDPCAG